ncbi:MAG TPA: hypothetical protein VMQ17_23265 [Candidatus Sulfotelmatobacter sp.]|nr:hypothetical protein [Candidatus Sulfotelmatobacter sp.]
MAATATPIVLVRQAKNMRYGVPACQMKTFDDGTALVRFAAGNILIVPVELLETATEAEEREYYSLSAA